jgi:hypothetical protein
VLAERAGHADLPTTKLYVQCRPVAIRRTFDARPPVLDLAGAPPDAGG